MHGSGATAPLLRRMNAQAVLDALLDEGTLSGAELMAATHLSRPTVHAVCDELIARGWAVELAARQPADASRPGRRARVYGPRARAGYVLGIDMGATTVRAALADLRGDVVAETGAAYRHDRVPADERIDATRAAVAAVLDTAGAAPAQVLGGALGVPAPVHPAGHAVAVEHYLPGLAAVDLRTALAPLVGVPLLVENDANLAVRAERWVGVAAGSDDAVLVLAGERLGAGVCLDGRILRGRHGATGEMGFLHLVEGVGDTDAVGNLARRWGAGVTGPAGRAEDVFAVARDGDRAALDVVDAVARRVGRALAVLATLLDPEVLVVGGAVAEGADVLMGPLARELARAAPAARARLVPSTLADRGVLLGAVKAALDDVRPRLLDLPAAG
ncbi:ROK family transcriptional regulator [Pseudonocardia nigra]|uniref:ROK family transcriptional regulator n=1 Tax=Pseudonocardia nigra TaxID=1921578 RepID=UPI001C5E79FF|nr:ROK family transcriptional regulator [Pseudonocardia nigra]